MNGISPSIYPGWELEILAHANNYNQWIASRFRNALKGRCLEVGAGRGTFSKLLLQENVCELVCLEPAANLVPSLQEELSQLPVSASGGQGEIGEKKPVTIIGTTLDAFARDCDDQFFDCVVCTNVLEHIADDAQAVTLMHRLTITGGHLCLFVPALKSLYGSLDAVFGHWRRYDKSELSELVARAGWHIMELRYFNSLGLVTWFAMSKLMRRRAWNVPPVVLYDRLIVPALRYMESLFPPPLGQSLLLIAQKE